MKKNMFVGSGLAVLFAFAIACSGNGSKNYTAQADAPVDQPPNGNVSVIITDGTPADAASTATPPSITTTDDAGVSDFDATIDTLPACLSRCEAAHPAGKVLDTGINTCWDKSCNPSCTQAAVSGNLYVGSDDGGGVAESGTCTHKVQTPSQDCSNCTVDKCCVPWDLAFSNDDFVALSNCAGGCFREFP